MPGQVELVNRVGRVRVSARLVSLTQCLGLLGAWRSNFIVITLTLCIKLDTAKEDEEADSPKYGGKHLTLFGYQPKS